MKTYLQHLIGVCVFLFGFVPISFAQIEEDSLVTEIDELLNIEVTEEKYISSASKYDQTLEEAPSSISVITSQDMIACGYHTLTDLLNAQRGFYYSSDRVTDNIGVRGFGRSSDRNNRILILLDGHRLNSYQVDNAPMGQSLGFNLSNFERVEIVRGPGSTLYGNNAIHGVINLITKKDRDSYIPSINLQYGSYNNKYIGLRTSKKITDNLSFSILGNYFNSEGDNIYFSEFDSPLTNNGLSKFDELSYNGLFSTIDYGDFHFTSMIKTYSKEIPTAPYSTDFNKKQVQYSNQEFIDVSWMPRLSYDKFIILKLSYDHQNYGSNLPFKFLENDFEFVGNSSTIGGDAQFIWDVLPNNRIIAGLEYKDNFNSRYKYFTGDYLFVDDNWSYKLFSLFFQNEFQFNADLSLYFGIRRDDFVGQEISYNPRAGIVYSLFKDHTFKILYGRSFRAPNLIERNLEEKNIVGFKRNESLKSEFINTFELIWNYSISEKIKSSVSYYHYKMEDLIDQVPDPVDDLLQYINSGEVTANGIEGELNYKFDLGSSYIRYSYQTAQDKFNNKITNSPEHLLKFGLNSKIMGPVNGSFELNYETKRKTILNEYTDPIFLANINLYSDTILDYFTVSFTINNLFNKTVKHPAGFEFVQKSLIQPYRNYLFTVGFEL